MRGTHSDGWPTILIVLLATFVGIVLLGSYSSGMMDGGMMDGGMMGGMMGFGWLLMVLPILLIVFLVSTLLDRDSTPQERTSQYGYYGPETPMQILERRYASGDISREDFYVMKEEIFNR